MSQIKKIMPVLIFVVGLLALTGCGDSNSQSAFNSDSGHPSNWVYAGHADAAKADASSCTECHGSDFSGGISGVACSTCHINGSPFVSTGCTSCHGNPPYSNIAPNRIGAHAPHNALAGVTNVCSTCHNGAGSGTANHDNGVTDVAILSAYNAKSGTAVHNADGTCSKVSCHGGQTTPVWSSGTLDVNTQCASCHAYGTGEYNSFVSGRHDFHVNSLGYGCAACHEPAQLVSSHFVSLNTSTMEGPASATIRNDFVHYDSIAQTCTSACHSSTPPDPRPW